MPHVFPDIGTRTTLTYYNSTDTAGTSVAWFAGLLDIGWSGAGRAVADMGTMTSTYKDFVAGKLWDMGQMDCELLFNSENTGTAGIAGCETGVMGAFVITWPDTGTWAYQGAVIEMGGAIPLEDRMTATATIKLSGNRTTTATV